MVELALVNATLQVATTTQHMPTLSQSALFCHAHGSWRRNSDNTMASACSAVVQSAS